VEIVAPTSPSFKRTAAHTKAKPQFLRPGHSRELSIVAANGATG
jgi:hypothetical protein